MSRINSLLKQMDNGCAVLLTSSENMLYFADFNGEGAVVISQDVRVIITDGRYTTVAKETCEDFEIYDNILVADFLKKLNKTVYFEKSITYGNFLSLSEKGIVLKPLEVDLDILRSVKDEKELGYLRQAAEIAEKALIEVFNDIKEGVSERFLASRLNFLMSKNGGTKPSFDTICVSGENTSKPHGVPTDKTIKKGEFLTVDFGCVVNGYCSDMTRTFAIGFADEEMRMVYETVLNAQKAATDKVKEGEDSFNCDKAARDIIAQKGYGEYFVHSTGHGVGLKIHEFPNLSPKSNNILKRGQVVTVEPGIYIPNKFGVRIENTLVVLENSNESLQKMDKNLIII
jgi:Xaa-Pro aminopeptidase